MSGISREYGPDEDAGGPFLDVFKEKMQIKFQHQTRDEIVFDMVGVDPAIANAFRRILLAEVPSVAIHTVFFINNTSIMQDEVLAHRLAMVPLLADPSMLEPRGPGDRAADNNTLVFELKARWDASAVEPGDEEKLLHVYSGQLLWVPQGRQEEVLQGFPRPRVVHDDILLLKLRPGQEVHAEVHATVGTGADHAKWSPVATAYYRFHPDVALPAPVEGAAAHALVRSCPMGVFDIEDAAGADRAVVARPRNCTMCRECVRPPGWADRVTLARRQRHFIFHVESTGALPARELVLRAVRVMGEKCRTILDSLDAADAVGGLGEVARDDDEEEGDENGEEGDGDHPDAGLLPENEMIAGDGRDGSDNDAEEDE